MDVGQTVGGIGGGIAGAALLGAIDGPLPFMDIVGGGMQVLSNRWMILEKLRR